MFVLSFFAQSDDEVFSSLKDKTDKTGFVLIQGGEFKNKNSNFFSRGVTIKPFYIGKYEITQKQWIDVMGKNPSLFKGDENLPVENITWYDAIEYCNKRSEKEGLAPFYIIDKTNKDPNNKSQYDGMKWMITFNHDSEGYRLPTEMEWEFANGGGVSADELKMYNSASENNTDVIKSVGQGKPNVYGLFDMSGNVWEWCWDWYGDLVLLDVSKIYGPDNGVYKVYRGGSWYFYAGPLQLYTRNNTYPTFKDYYVGLRVVRSKLK